MKQRQRTRWLVPALVVAVFAILTFLLGRARSKPARAPAVRTPSPRRPRKNVAVVFLGDSLVGGWQMAGAPVWKERYEHRGAVALGFPGARARDVLRSIRSGELRALAPRLVVLLVGTNDLGSGASARSAAQAVARCVGALRAALPDARILVLGIFPRGDARRGSRLRRDVGALNAALAKLADGAAVRFLDIGAAFTTARRGVRPELFEEDKLHLSTAGYRAWADAMAPVFNALA